MTMPVMMAGAIAVAIALAAAMAGAVVITNAVIVGIHIIFPAVSTNAGAASGVIADAVPVRVSSPPQTRSRRRGTI